ncbi:MAG: PqiC family protein [Thermoanaerobaculales bacterium]|nr:PqiC family protein [Thermoanaerobaculales bacterium]
MNLRPLVFAVLCVSCACASAPKINYYSLGMESSDEARPAVNLTVERLRTTEALGRSQIMIRASATRIEYYAVDHWAGGLGELVQQRLATAFGPPVEGRNTFKVSGMVVACEQVDRPGGSEARVKLNIVIRDADEARYQPPLLEKTYQASRGVAKPCVEALVDVLSRCVDQIAAEIAADVSSL